MHELQSVHSRGQILCHYLSGSRRLPALLMAPEHAFASAGSDTIWKSRSWWLPCRPQKGLLGVVKVKAVNATDGTGPPGAQQPPAKKQKLDDSSADAASFQAAAGPRESPAASPPAAADDAGSSEEGGLAGLLGGSAVSA